MGEQGTSMRDEIAMRDYSMGSGAVTPTLPDGPQVAGGSQEFQGISLDVPSKRPARPQVVEASDAIYARMLREVRSWGLAMLAWGLLSLLAGGVLSAPWGIMLLLVGLASFYFREAAIFVVYGVTLTWVAISNLMGFDVVWMGIALVQIIMAVQVFRQYRRFRQAQAEQAALYEWAAAGSPVPERAARIFPWAGGLLGVLALVGLVTIVVLLIIAVATEELLPFFDLLIDFVVDLGVLSIAVSLAALLSGYRYKLVSVCGLAAGAVVLLAYLGLFLLIILG